MQIKTLHIVCVILLFCGCSSVQPIPNFSVSTSQPIFITNFKNSDTNAMQKSVYIFFKNSSGYQNNLENATRNKISTLGFVQNSDISKADIVILGDFISLERFEYKARREPRIFMDMGYGWGSRGWRSRSFGLGMMLSNPFFEDDWDYQTDYYIYKAIVSVMIRANGDEQRANIEIKSGANLYSVSRILPFIEEKVANQILNFFY